MAHTAMVAGLAEHSVVHLAADLVERWAAPWVVLQERHSAGHWALRQGGQLPNDVRTTGAIDAASSALPDHLQPQNVATQPAGEWVV